GGDGSNPRFIKDKGFAAGNTADAGRGQKILSVVVDASVALSWILPGEGAALCLSLRDSAAANPKARLFVPPDFWYEVANTLWVAACRERLT
ncbi:MAG: type II toxin-antitoxin system VapC family toxin, partial [Firmicutes bacterium]|nr:type II toxin-antitoxin system VapC family toxin [Bacillota bacterium]